MRISINPLKKIAIALMPLALVAIGFSNTSPVPVKAAIQEFDATTFYKAKCAMCHGPKAEKNFDVAKSDAQLIESVLKGVKPKMPAYDMKGVDAEKARALVSHMKE